MLFASLVLSVAAVASVVVAAQERFDGHRVYAGVASDEVVRVVREHSVDVWLPSHGVAVANRTLHVRVAPDASRAVHDALAAARFDVLVHDVQPLVDGARVHSDESFEAALRAKVSAWASGDARRVAAASDDFFGAFPTWEQLKAYTEKLAAAHSSIVTLVPSIGKSIEGRDLLALEVSTSAGGVGASRGDKPVAWLNGGIHAREWITPITVTYVVTKLLEQYAAGDEHVTELLNAVDILYVPDMNPDGYVYSHESSRMWRKNRRANADGSFGVDLNRNFDLRWCQYGGSRTPSSDIYCGESAFSEPETAAVAKYITERPAGRLVGGIDYHAYGQYVMRPYGDIRDKPPNEATLVAVGKAMVDAIAANSSKVFSNIPGWELYPVSGATSDWWYEEGPKAPLSYTIECRDTGRYGFIPPASEIVPSGNENYVAWLAYMDAIVAHGVRRK